MSRAGGDPATKRSFRCAPVALRSAMCRGPNRRADTACSPGPDSSASSSSSRSSGRSESVRNGGRPPSGLGSRRSAPGSPVPSWSTPHLQVTGDHRFWSPIDHRLVDIQWLAALSSGTAPSARARRSATPTGPPPQLGPARLRGQPQLTWQSAGSHPAVVNQVVNLHVTVWNGRPVAAASRMAVGPPISVTV